MCVCVCAQIIMDVQNTVMLLSCFSEQTYDTEFNMYLRMQEGLMVEKAPNIPGLTPHQSALVMQLSKLPVLSSLPKIVQSDPVSIIP